MVLRDEYGSIETILDLSLRVAVVPEDMSVDGLDLFKARLLAYQ